MIGIIILNYNSWDQTSECIKSIFDANLKLDFRIYLVDNNSSVPIPEYMKKYIKIDNLIYLQSKLNKGFAAGNNIGLREAYKDECEYFILSNNDVVIKKGVIEEIIEDLSNYEDVGIIGPRVVLPNGKMQETHLGCKMTLGGKYIYILRKTPLKRWSEGFLSNYIIDDNLKESRYVYGVSGCFFGLSRKCLQDIGYLDENTFLYEEENILGVKMEEKGWKTIYNPTITILHKHGQSTKEKAFAYICQIESEIYYCKKYLHKKNFTIFPLYTIRMLRYIKQSLNSKDYRKNFIKCIIRTHYQFRRKN